MLKIIYAGTPQFAVPALEALIRSAHQVVAVYTQPDRPAGRGRKLRFSPVKDCALQHEIPVMQPQAFENLPDVEQLRSFSADLMVVAAYGILLPQPILDAPRLGCINIHASLLPRWRGAAPVQRAILAGDRQTGITLMQMDAGLDTGDMLAKVTLDIDRDATAASIHDELKQLGAELLMNHLDKIEKSQIIVLTQDNDEACYAYKLGKQEALIDWGKPADVIDREIRAFNPWPVSFTSLQGQNVKVWSATCSTGTENETCPGSPGRILFHHRQGITVCCGSGVLTVTQLQFAGKQCRTAEQVFNAGDLTGKTFGH